MLQCMVSILSLGIAELEMGTDLNLRQTSFSLKIVLQCLGQVKKYVCVYCNMSGKKHVFVRFQQELIQTTGMEPAFTVVHT